jgi:Tfp pilus assembly protein PilX
VSSKKSKGAALVIVIMVFAVMMILGTALLQKSVAETKQVAYDKKKMQAYYLAKSGVEASAAWMMNSSNNSSALIGKTSTSTSLGNGTEGTFTVEVIDKSSTEILIRGTGTVDGVSAKAGLILNKNMAPGGTSVFTNTLYAVSTIVLQGNTTVNGNVASGGIIDTNGRALTVTGTVTENTPMNVLSPVFPADPSTASNLDVGNSDVNLNIATAPNKMMVYKKLEMNNTGTLTIQTGSIVGEIVNLVVDELDLKGVVKVQGSGKVYLYVKTFANFGCDTNYNYPDASNPAQMLINLGDGCGAQLDANKHINAAIYGPRASVTISGNNGFNGAIIANTISCSGTPFISYGAGVSSITFDMLPVLRITRGRWVNQ